MYIMLLTNWGSITTLLMWAKVERGDLEHKEWTAHGEKMGNMEILVVEVATANAVNMAETAVLVLTARTAYLGSVLIIIQEVVAVTPMMWQRSGV
jgi:hypothetical protein